jgi:hypothetical protein
MCKSRETIPLSQKQIALIYCFSLRLTQYKLVQLQIETNIAVRSVRSRSHIVLVLYVKVTKCYDF